MKKQELLKIIDDELFEKLFGFCYGRTNDSYEAQELCSDIIFALIKAANSDGDIENVYSYIWRIARNVYADFLSKRKLHSNLFYEGDTEELLSYIAQEQIEDNSDELLVAVYRQISFLSKAYREVMIMFYLDGLSTAEIAKRQNTSEVAIRQRLFSARKKVRKEVEEMNGMESKPVALDRKEYYIMGTGDPGWSDPRSGLKRQFSKHILWLCRKKPMNANEIASQLNVPTVYVEEELGLLKKGENGKYGFLRKLDNGKYAINFILLDRETIEKAQAIYEEQLPNICNVICDFIEKNKEAYLSFPYLNSKFDLNLILWQQISTMSYAFSENVKQILEEDYFDHIVQVERPFSIFGYVDNGQYYGGGWDGMSAYHICGYDKVHLENIYITRIKRHFSCGSNVSTDVKMQLALRAVDGLDIQLLSEAEKEHAAKAIQCGYLYREGERLFTKILVSDMKDRDQLFAISERLSHGYFKEEAKAVADKIAAMIRKNVPEYLLPEWRFFNMMANLPVLDSLVEVLIEKGILIPPEDGIGAEGCWVSVAK